MLLSYDVRTPGPGVSLPSVAIRLSLQNLGISTKSRRHDDIKERLSLTKTPANQRPVMPGGGQSEAGSQCWPLLVSVTSPSSGVTSRLAVQRLTFEQRPGDMTTLQRHMGLANQRAVWTLTANQRP